MTESVEYRIILHDEFSKVVKEAVQGTKRLDKATERASKKSEKINKQLANSFKDTKNQIIGIGAAYFGFNKVVNTIADFGEAMSEVKMKTGATEKEFEKLKNQAMELGETTKFSATKAAEAQVFLAKAGLKTTEILGMMPHMLDLAAAGNLDLAQTADIVTNVMTPFKVSIEDTQKVVDSFSVVSNNSNTNLIELGSAMSKVAPIAAGFGFSIQEVNSMLGALGDSGIKAEVAGTHLKIILNRLVKPTKEVKNGLAEMGISADDLSPAIHSSQEILETLRKGFENIKDPTKRAAAMIQVFGSEAVAAGKILTGETEKIGKLTKMQNENAGITKEQARNKKNLKVALNNLNSAIEGLILRGGKGGLTGVLMRATEASTEFFRNVGKADEIRNTTGAMEGLLDIMDGVIGIVQKASEGWADLFDIIGKFGEFKEDDGFWGAVKRSTDVALTKSAGRAIGKKGEIGTAHGFDTDTFEKTRELQKKGGGGISKYIKIVEEEKQLQREKAFKEIKEQKIANENKINGNINVNFTNAPKGTEVSSAIDTNTNVGLGTNMGGEGF